MNKTTVDLDLSTEGHKTVILKCHVRGMPKPNVTWYKVNCRCVVPTDYNKQKQKIKKIVIMVSIIFFFTLNLLSQRHFSKQFNVHKKLNNRPK